MTFETIHRELTRFNQWRLNPRVDFVDRTRERQREHVMSDAEECFVEAERSNVRRAAAKAPSEPEAFVRWFEDLRSSGPGQHDRLFPWLARNASLSEMKWFLGQEMAGEAGFDDLVALTQVKLPTRAKLEMARNYWDEMGQGHAAGTHGQMLEDLACALSISADSSSPVWESLALSNLMVALACNRRYAYHAVGALGAIELTAPDRAEHVNAALKRLGVGGEARRYYAVHATLDVKHSMAWNREVLVPLVEAEPLAAQAIAEGALMRLRAGARCFERYRRELNVR